MPGRVPGSHVLDLTAEVKDGDGRDKPGHDVFGVVREGPKAGKPNYFHSILVIS